MQRLLWRHETLEQEVGLVQAQVEVCSWVWRWTQGTSSVGPREGMPRTRGVRDLESSQAHSAVTPAGASYSQCSPE